MKSKYKKLWQKLLWLSIKSWNDDPLSANNNWLKPIQIMHVIQWFIMWNIQSTLVFHEFFRASLNLARKCSSASWSVKCGTRVSFRYSMSRMHETSWMPVFIIIMKSVMRNLLCCRRIWNALWHSILNLEKLILNVVFFLWFTKTFRIL